MYLPLPRRSMASVAALFIAASTLARGDCITEPISAARVNGQIVGAGSE